MTQQLSTLPPTGITSTVPLPRLTWWAVGLVLVGIERKVPPILHHDDSIKVKLDAVVKAFR